LKKIKKLLFIVIFALVSISNLNAKNIVVSNVETLKILLLNTEIIQLKENKKELEIYIENVRKGYSNDDLTPEMMLDIELRGEKIEEIDFDIESKEKELIQINNEIFK
jgi:hypothetical protein